MNHLVAATIAWSAMVLGTATTMARADCESDMGQLEAAYKTQNLKPEAVAALDVAKQKSVAAMKKDDDDTCHRAIAEGLAKAGIPMR